MSLLLCIVLCAFWSIALCACYVVSGTDLGYRATSTALENAREFNLIGKVSRPPVLHVHYLRYSVRTWAMLVTSLAMLVPRWAMLALTCPMLALTCSMSALTCWVWEPGVRARNLQLCHPRRPLPDGALPPPLR
eukprot:366928-Rhodomonas_salina.2